MSETPGQFLLAHHITQDHTKKTPETNICSPLMVVNSLLSKVLIWNIASRTPARFKLYGLSLTGKTLDLRSRISFGNNSQIK